MVISVPRALGEPASEVEFARIGDAVTVSGPSGAAKTAMR
jgi:hypothetical protein